jgi:hypothetical protein
VENQSSYSKYQPSKCLEKFILDSDNLSPYELGYLNDMIDSGTKECTNLLGKQKDSQMFYFYEGSIEGFQECKKYTRISEFEKQLKELLAEEHKEISRGAIKDKELREELGIYDSNEETDIKEVWKIKGIRTQVEYVYGRIIAFRTLCSGSIKCVNPNL